MQSRAASVQKRHKVREGNETEKIKELGSVNMRNREEKRGRNHPKISLGGDDEKKEEKKR